MTSTESLTIHSSAFEIGQLDLEKLYLPFLNKGRSSTLPVEKPVFKKNKDKRGRTEQGEIFDVGEYVHAGQFSTVYMGRMTETGEIIAYKLPAPNLSTEQKQTFYREIEVVGELTKNWKANHGDAPCPFPVMFSATDLVGDSIKIDDSARRGIVMEYSPSELMLGTQSRRIGTYNLLEAENFLSNKFEEYLRLVEVVNLSGFSVQDRKTTDLRMRENGSLIVIDWNVYGENPSKTLVRADIFKAYSLFYQLFTGTFPSAERSDILANFIVPTATRTSTAAMIFLDRLRTISQQENPNIEAFHAAKSHYDEVYFMSAEKLRSSAYKIAKQAGIIKTGYTVINNQKQYDEILKCLEMYDMAARKDPNKRTIQSVSTILEAMRRYQVKTQPKVEVLHVKEDARLKTDVRLEDKRLTSIREKIFKRAPNLFLSTDNRNITGEPPLLLRDILIDPNIPRVDKEEIILKVLELLLSAEESNNPPIMFFVDDLASDSKIFFNRDVNDASTAVLQTNNAGFEIQSRNCSLGMTKSFIHSLRIYLTNRNLPHTLSTLDFSDDAQWEGSDLSYAVRNVLSEIGNNNSLSVEDARKLIEQARYIMLMPDERIVELSTDYQEMEREGDRIRETNLTQMQRDPSLVHRLNIDTYFELSRSALVLLNQEHLRKLQDGLATQSVMTEVERIRTDQIRFFRHFYHAIAISNYKIINPIADKFMSKLVDSRHYESAAHLFRYKFIGEYLSNEGNSEHMLPEDLREELLGFMQDNKYGLNLDMLETNKDKVVNLLDRLDAHILEASSTGIISGNMRDFINDIRYRILMIESEELGDNDMKKSEVFTKAKKVLSSITNVEFKDTILQMAPDLDLLIEMSEKSSKLVTST